MKKLVAVVLVVFAMAGFATTATATGPLSTTCLGFCCGTIDRDGSLVLTTDSRLILFASGKVTLRCIADGTPGSNIVVFSGFLCGLGSFGVTTNSTNRVGKNGEIQLYCHSARSERRRRSGSYGHSRSRLVGSTARRESLGERGSERAAARRPVLVAAVLG